MDARACARRARRAQKRVVPSPHLTPASPSQVINIVRDPRWGRNIESAGEDPFLSGAYARDFVLGFEHATETGDSGYPLQASACCKHFVANELDGWNGTSAPIPVPLTLHCGCGRARWHCREPLTPPPFRRIADREHIDSYVPQQDLVDSYLPSFQTCVEEGKVSGIMVR